MNSINFEKNDDALVLLYETESSWVEESFISKDSIQIFKSFNFQRSDLIGSDESVTFTYRFLFGVRDGKYYYISKEKLFTKFDLLIDCSLPIDWSWFVTATKKRVRYTNGDGHENYTSIYGNILYAFNDFYKGERLYIDGDSEQDFEDDGFHVTLSTYKHFLEVFPTATNAKYQKLAIFTNILRNELDVDDYEEIYQEYKAKHIAVKSTQSVLPQALREQEKNKFIYAKTQLEKALEEQSRGNFIHEDTFSKIIAEFFCLLNPKYINVCTKINIKDYTGARDNCQADLCLIDYDGNIDLIEVKSPTHPNLFRKKPYRNHYVPCGELNGAINQLQQYLKSLTKMSSTEIVDKNRDLQDKLGSIKLRAVHPKGYIIFGRDDVSFSGENAEQKKVDFEIMRNTYRDVVDILTFDDLVKRFNHIISFL